MTARRTVFVMMLAACAAAPDEPPLDGADDRFLDGKGDSLIDGAGVLQLVNRLSAAELTDICRLHSVVAGNIADYRERNGSIPDLETLDAIPYVGPRAFDNLGRCWDDYYRDNGEGSWRAPFGLPDGPVQMNANLVIPAYESDDWSKVNATLEEVLDDPLVQLRSVMEYAQCQLRGTHPGPVYVECRRRAFRSSMLGNAEYQTRDRKSFIVRAEVAGDGTFAAVHDYDDGYQYGEQHYLQVAGRLVADRTILLSTWKYVYITPYSNGGVQQFVQDLAWGADEGSARFHDGTWDHFDEISGAMVPIAAGVSRRPCVAIPGDYLWWVEECDGGERATDVAAFAIDTDEVTRAAYSACVQEGSCTSPCSLTRSIEDCVWLNDHGFESADTHPMTGIIHYQAERFCAWAGRQRSTPPEATATAVIVRRPTHWIHPATSSRNVR